MITLAEYLDGMTVEGTLYEPLADQALRCYACGHRCLILKVEPTDEGERLARGDRRITDQFAEHPRRDGRPAPPYDLAACRRLPAVTCLRQPGGKAAVPVTGRAEARHRIGTDTKRLEFPAVSSFVGSGQRSPGTVGPLTGDTTEGDGKFPTHLR